MIVSELTGIVEIKFEGDLANLNCHNAVVNGVIKGNVSTHNIECKNIGGNVSSHNVNCEKIYGTCNAKNIEED